MIQLVSVPEKRLEIFKGENYLSRSEPFCTAGDTNGTGEDLHHHHCREMVGFAMEMISHNQMGDSQGAEALVVPAENQGDRLTSDQHPRALSILQPTPR